MKSTAGNGVLKDTSSGCGCSDLTLSTSRVTPEVLSLGCASGVRIRSADLKDEFDMVRCHSLSPAHWVIQDDF